MERVILKTVLALCCFVSLILVACSEQPDVKTYDVGPGGRHTDGDVDYAQTPPVGGEHNPVWQNCGFYEEPVRDENAVHSLEHGAVWITYQPDIPQDEIELLRDLAQSNSYILVSPYPDQDAPVVVTAWGIQQRLWSAEDPELEQFIKIYGQDPKSAPAGGHSSCTGGIGQPLLST